MKRVQVVFLIEVVNILRDSTLDLVAKTLSNTEMLLLVDEFLNNFHDH